MSDSARPEEPENVRLVDFDGVEHPVDLIYTGQDRDGTHIWEIVPPWPPVFPRGAVIETLPPRTMVAFVATL